MPTEEDFRRSVDAARRHSLAKRQRQLHQVELAGPPMDVLVKDDSWDAYLKMLQPRIDLLRGYLESVTDRLLNGYEVDEQEILRLRLQSKYLQGGIEQLEHAQRLPKQILEKALEARNLVKESA